MRINENSLLSKARRAYKREGIVYIFLGGTRLALEYIRYKIFRRYESFEFQGTKYRYFHHANGRTWNTERSVEIPIVWGIVKKYRMEKKNILEIGNVLSYRFQVDHEILDKYETVNGIINQDIVGFSPVKRYDLIISISTLEHVGWDEEPKERDKILRAIQNMESLLSPGGQIMVTFPLGYNPELDSLLGEGKVMFTEKYYLQRKPNNRWEQTEKVAAQNTVYDNSIPAANGIVIGIIRKSS